MNAAARVAAVLVPAGVLAAVAAAQAAHFALGWLLWAGTVALAVFVVVGLRARPRVAATMIIPLAIIPLWGVGAAAVAFPLLSSDFDECIGGEVVRLMIPAARWCSSPSGDWVLLSSPITASMLSAALLVIVATSVVSALLMSRAGRSDAAPS